MIRYYLSTPKMTISVAVDENDIIKGGTPIIKRFTGQSFGNLLDWLKKQGEVIMIEI